MTVQLTPSQEQRLQQLAAQAALTPDEFLREGVNRLLDYEEGLFLAVKRGDEDIAAGRVLEHDEVVTRIEKLLADL